MLSQVGDASTRGSFAGVRSPSLFTDDIMPWTAVFHWGKRMYEVLANLMVL